MTSPRRATRVLPRCPPADPRPTAGAGCTAALVGLTVVDARGRSGHVPERPGEPQLGEHRGRPRGAARGRRAAGPARPCRAPAPPGRPRPRPRRGPGRRPAGWSSRSGPRRPTSGPPVKEPGHVRLGRRGLGVGQHGQRPPAAGAGGGHQHFLVERGHDPERVPGAAPPLLLGRGDHEVHLPAENGWAMRTPTRSSSSTSAWASEASPAGQDLLDPELEAPGGLGGRGRAALLHELAVDDLPELPQASGVVGLHRRSFAVPYRDEEYAGLDTREPGPPG